MDWRFCSVAAIRLLEHTDLFRTNQKTRVEHRRMKEEFYKIIVKVPEEWVGHTMGYLTELHSWLEDMKNENGIYTVQAQLPKHQLDTFKKWLEKTTNSEGQCTVAKKSQDS